MTVGCRIFFLVAKPGFSSKGVSSVTPRTRVSLLLIPLPFVNKFLLETGLLIA